MRRTCYAVLWLEKQGDGAMQPVRGGLYSESPGTLTHQFGTELPVTVVECSGKSFQKAMESCRAHFKGCAALGPDGVWGDVLELFGGVSWGWPSPERTPSSLDQLLSHPVGKSKP